MPWVWGCVFSEIGMQQVPKTLFFLQRIKPATASPSVKKNANVDFEAWTNFLFFRAVSEQYLHFLYRSFLAKAQCYGATGTMSHRHIIPFAMLCFRIEEENVPTRRAP